jgi:hypothetical protein
MEGVQGNQKTVLHDSLLLLKLVQGLAGLDGGLVGEEEDS